MQNTLDFQILTDLFINRVQILTEPINNSPYWSTVYRKRMNRNQYQTTTTTTRKATKLTYQRTTWELEEPHQGGAQTWSVTREVPQIRKQGACKK